MGALSLFINTLLLFLAVNVLPICFVLKVGTLVTVLAAVAATAVFITINLKPTNKKYHTPRLYQLKAGSILLVIFLIICVMSIAFGVYYLFFASLTAAQKIVSVILTVLTLFIAFANGIMRVYLTSVQMGVGMRLIGVLCGFLPIINIVVLVKIIAVTNREAEFEEQKLLTDEVQAENYLCRTKYPILLVHGVFFRDIRFFNYWGRVPATLKRNGCEIFYGNQASAASVEVCAEELAQKIDEVLKQTGAKKVNIIAHSKGGLDSRCAICKFALSDKVATLTTINTPHRGCEFADVLLQKVPEKMRLSLADKYNKTLKRLGDREPDFIGAVTDLTASRCKEINEKYPDADGVYYQSVGSVMSKAKSGKFPLNLSYHLVKRFDGENDGLVSLEAMKWGERFITINADKRYRRGISHGDVIDLNRENIDGFDVRDFYKELVIELKNKGF